MGDYAVLLAGCVCAGLGGEFFVRGSVGLALFLRISPGIVAATVAAFATSSPELSVAVSASLAGSPQITLGDALGSNVVNVALILGLVLAFSGMHCARDSIKRDFPVALLAPAVTAILLVDGVLSRLDALLMLCVFGSWLLATVVEARKQRDLAGGTDGHYRFWPVLLSLVIGLAGLVVAGNLVVAGARGIAQTFGLGEFVIGAVIVAVGTSVPELATTLIACLRGHDEVGLGTVLGSNIFNGLFIVAIAAMIHPIRIFWQEVAIALTFGVLALVLAYPGQQGGIARWRGGGLLLLYASYVAMLLLRQE